LGLDSRLTGDELFENFCGRDPWQVGAPRRRGERQSETDEIVDWVANDRLIKIPDLDGDSPLRIRQRSEITDVTIPAYPNSRSSGDFGRWRRPAIRRI
jgi:hypothetical protein